MAAIGSGSGGPRPPRIQDFILEAISCLATDALTGGHPMFSYFFLWPSLIYFGQSGAIMADWLNMPRFK